MKGSDQLLAVSDQREIDEPTPTQQIWAPVADLNEAHLQAFRELQSAVASGDEVGMKTAFDAIVFIEAKQRQVHAEARAYLVAKAARHG